MAWFETLLWWLAGTASLVFLLWALGCSRWRALTQELTSRLEAARQPAPTARYDAARELEGLPKPVQRYLRAVLKDGQPMVAAVQLEHRGHFNLGSVGVDRWRPFTSTQRVQTRRPGFVWDGRVAVLPGVAIHVHDAYVAGEGLLRPALLGLVRLMDLRGSSPEPGGVAQGEFLRFFAESAWYPTVLLPSHGVRWTAVDEHSARATLVDGRIGAELLFRFDPATGLVDSVRAEARGRAVGKRVVLTPWEGRWSDYAERDGLRVPTRGEVAWLTGQGRLSYWRGVLGSLRYEFVCQGAGAAIRARSRCGASNAAR